MVICELSAAAAPIPYHSASDIRIAPEAAMSSLAEVRTLRFCLHQDANTRVDTRATYRRYP
jgi:hypothetical protein